MISLSIEKIIKYWIKNNVIHENDSDIYEYGLDLFLFSAINISIIFITALLTNKLAESIILLIIMIPLQSIGGGYHAKTHLRCFLIMYIGWWIIIFVTPFINHIPTISISSCSMLIIFLLAPVPNINVPISDLRRQQLKIMIRMVSVMIGTVSIMARPFMVNSNVSLSGILSLGMGGIAISMVMANLKNKYGQQHL